MKIDIRLAGLALLVIFAIFILGTGDAYEKKLAAEMTATAAAVSTTNPTNTPTCPDQPPEGWKNYGQYMEIQSSSGILLVKFVVEDGEGLLYYNEDENILEWGNYPNPITLPQGSCGDITIIRSTEDIRILFYFDGESYYLDVQTVSKAQPNDAL